MGSGLPREAKVAWSSSCAELSEPLLEDIGSDMYVRVKVCVKVRV